MTDQTTRNYVLTFDIPPDLYRRAITHPIPGRERPQGPQLYLQVGLVVLLATGSMICFSLAIFDFAALAPMGFGFTLGAAIVLGVWWRQHRSLVGMHMDVNARAERHHLEIDATGIIAARDHIRSEIGWPFVNAIRSIDAATLIEVQTARLIVPDAAVEGSVDTFRAQLEAWRSA